MGTKQKGVRKRKDRRRRKRRHTLNVVSLVKRFITKGHFFRVEFQSFC
jgi:hypothetical protein